MAHKLADWLHHPCRPAGPQHFRARDKIRSGPQVGRLATSPLPSMGSPTLQSAEQNQKWPTSGQIGYITSAVRGSTTLQSTGQNQKWPTSGQIGYITPAVRGVPNASKRGTKSEMGHKLANWLHHLCRPRVHNTSKHGTKSAVAHKWAGWLHHPWCVGGPQRFTPGDKISSGPQVGRLAASPLASGGSPTLHSTGQNEQWPTSGPRGYITPADSGIPIASELGTKSAVAHKWVNWLQQPSWLERRQCFRVGRKSAMAHKWADWLHHPSRLGGPQRFKAEDKISSGPQGGRFATSPLPYGGPTLQGAGNIHKWSTSGQIGYTTPADWGVPNGWR